MEWVDRKAQNSKQLQANSFLALVTSGRSQGQNMAVGFSDILSKYIRNCQK